MTLKKKRDIILYKYVHRIPLYYTILHKHIYSIIREREKKRKRERETIYVVAKLQNPLFYKTCRHFIKRPYSQIMIENKIFYNR